MTGNIDKDFRPCGPGRLLRRLSTWLQDKRPLLSLTGERGLLLSMGRFIAQAKYLINMKKIYPNHNLKVNETINYLPEIKFQMSFSEFQVML